MNLPHDPTQSRDYAPTLRLFGTAVLLAAAVAAPAPARGGDDVQYNRDVRPILADNCFACHGPDSAARKADLRLDTRKDAIDSGAIQPKSPADSELIARITTTEPEDQMPPAKSGKVLTAAQKEILRKWIAAGAEYQPHWSLIAPVRPPLPEVRDAAWVRNPIDRFVLAKLEANGLHPAPEADRRTLARRLSLDLTGLPPEPADVDRFVADDSPDAYAAYVDRLLKSPRWGEHRAKYWLDAARYADTHGYHFDNFREMWSYRDWVIAAFNRNLPFDQFTIEQLAGDLLPNPTVDQLVASGFNRCNMTTNEGGVIPEEFAVLYTRDRTETASQVWLGLTTGCAVCHDHKFDPIPQQDFYELSAFFNNTTQKTMDGNIRDTPPVVTVPKRADRDRWAALHVELQGVQGEIDARAQAARGDFDSWLAALAARPEPLDSLSPADGLKLHAELTPSLDPGPVKTAADSTSSKVKAIEFADAGDFDTGQSFSIGAWVKLGEDRATGSMLARIDDRTQEDRGWEVRFQDSKVVVNLIHARAADALRVVSVDAVPRNAWTHVTVTYDGSAQPEGVKVHLNGRVQDAASRLDTLKKTSTIRAQVPLKVGQRHLGGKLDGLDMHDLRIYDRALSAAEVERLSGVCRAAELIRKPAEKRDKAEVEAVYAWWLGSIDPASRDSRARRAAIDQEIAAIQSRGTIAYVSQERAEPATAYVLHRGDYDKRRQAVHPDTPSALPPMPADLPRNRLGLAKWLLRPEHPLTARVTVNRFWQEVFGAGIVRTTGDFGVTGELPTDAALLDWMAVEFRESGWDVRRFFKLIVSSATYRQSAATTPEKLEKDRANQFFSRGPRFRMDAEMVRDYALEASGLLSDDLGGPSVRPYQPDGVWEAVAMPESNTHDYKQDAGEALYRRSLYTFWKRAAPPASLEIFNAPSREVCTVRRERTNTPLQALVTLNDPQYVEAARALAQLALKQTAALSSGDDAGRIDFMARRILARPLRPEEAAVVQNSLARLTAAYQASPEEADKLLAVGELKVDPGADRPSLAAWTMLANELLNLDEVLNK